MEAPETVHTLERIDPETNGSTLLGVFRTRALAEKRLKAHLTLTIPRESLKSLTQATHFAVKLREIHDLSHSSNDSVSFGGAVWRICKHPIIEH